MGYFFIFDEVFCINLDHRKDRWKKINEHFNPYGVFPTRVSAVYGKQFSRKELNKFTTPLAAKFCPKSAIGCAMTHQKIWKQIVDSGLNSALIFEDDAYPTHLFSQLKTIWKEVPSDWDIVYIGSINWYTPKLLENDKHVCILKPVWFTGMHAYAISNKGARKLLEKTTPITYHIDVQLAIEYLKDTDIRVFCIFPDLVKQKLDSDYSDNQSKGLKPINNLLSKIKINGYTLDPAFNALLFSIGNKDFSAGDVFIASLVTIIVLTMITFKEKRKS